MRIDVPTLQCDRCGMTTQDLAEMGKYRKVVHYNEGPTLEWDLCLDCWKTFEAFMDGDA